MLKKKQAKVTRSFYIDKGLYERFQALCKKKGLSSGEVVEAFIEIFLSENPADKDTANEP